MLPDNRNIRRSKTHVFEEDLVDLVVAWVVESIAVELQHLVAAAVEVAEVAAVEVVEVAEYQ